MFSLTKVWEVIIYTQAFHYIREIFTKRINYILFITYNLIIDK